MYNCKIKVLVVRAAGGNVLSVGHHLHVNLCEVNSPGPYCAGECSKVVNCNTLIANDTAGPALVLVLLKSAHTVYITWDAHQTLICTHGRQFSLYFIDECTLDRVGMWITGILHANQCVEEIKRQQDIRETALRNYMECINIIRSIEYGCINYERCIRPRYPVASGHVNTGREREFRVTPLDDVVGKNLAINYFNVPEGCVLMRYQ